MRVYAIMRERVASPVEIARELEMAPLGTIAYHVKVLEGLGVIELVDNVHRRGAIEHRYRAVGGEIGDLIGTVIDAVMSGDVGPYKESQARSPDKPPIPGRKSQARRPA
jgi:DNA-binding transcriptional ArsR family regulator